MFTGDELAGLMATRLLVMIGCVVVGAIGMWELGKFLLRHVSVVVDWL